ncbi:MAG: porin family protein [Flavitalea sp.]
MKPSMLKSQKSVSMPSSNDAQKPFTGIKFKMLSLFIFALALTSVSFAQGFHIGVKGGVNMFKIDGKSFSDEFKYGYNAGAFAEINFSKKFGIQPEVLWNQAQTRTTEHFKDVYNQGFSSFKNVKLNYLSVPLLLSFRPSKIITFQAGPQFGILINHSEDLLMNGKNAFRSGDLSLLGGVQLNLGGLKVGGRYVAGLSNINDIDNQEKWRNQGFQLYVGFRII